MTKAAPSVKQLFDLTGRVALVTGAAMGIGREIAEGLLEAGAKVAFTSRKPDCAEKVAHEMSTLTGGETLGVTLDVWDEQDVASAFGLVADRWGKLDALVNNAGGAPPAEHYHVWDRKIDTAGRCLVLSRAVWQPRPAAIWRLSP
jgi:NAD(P)-dependent dehydrogenase (short-subunit alcohol dehydrogenase family)